MNRNGVGQVQLHNVIFLVKNLSVVRKKGNRTGQLLYVHSLYDTYVAVKHSKIIIISSMDNPITNPEDPLADL